MLGMFFASPPAVLQTVLPWLLDLAQWGCFSILEPPISTKTPSKSHPKKKLLKLYHTTYLFRKPPFQKKRQGPIRNLDLREKPLRFLLGNSNGLKVEATKIGRATWARCTARIDTSVDDMDDMESHSDPVDWPQQKSSKSSKVPSMWKAVPSDNRQPIFHAGWDPAEMAASKGSIRSKSASVIFCKALKHEFLSRIHSSSPKLWWTSSPFFDEVSTFGSRIYSYITWCSTGHTTSSGPSGPTPWMPATNLTNPPWKWIEMVKRC